jgi:hypothetical protein
MNKMMPAAPRTMPKTGPIAKAHPVPRGTTGSGRVKPKIMPKAPRSTATTSRTVTAAPVRTQISDSFGYSSGRSMAGLATSRVGGGAVATAASARRTATAKAVTSQPPRPRKY